MSPSDIKLYLSGGSGNNNPAASLGGEISNTLATASLFPAIAGEQSRVGLIDYRCVYVKNTHSTESMRNVKLYVDSERSGGSFIDIGAVHRDEQQKINVSGPKPPNEDESMTLTVPEFGSLTIPYHINQTIWQGRFQTEIAGLDGLKDVRVSAVGDIGWPTNLTFTIDFAGEACCRLISLIQVVTHDLDQQTLTILKTLSGAPVETEAVEAEDQYTAPPGIVFQQTLRDNPLTLGDLHPGNSAPIWFRRTTPVNTTAFKNDNFLLHVDGTFP